MPASTPNPDSTVAHASPPSVASAGTAIDIPHTGLTIEPFPGQRAAVIPRLSSDGNTVIVAGERSWLIRGAPGEIDRAAAALAGLCRRLDGALLQVDFGNAVGRFPLAGGAIEVVSGKWTAAHFDQMLEELTAIAAGLPFTAGTGGALPYHRTHAARHDVLYHAFVYLRHIVLGNDTSAGTVDNGIGRPIGAGGGGLPAALAVILADPHRRWERDERAVPIERARDVDAHALFDAVLGKVPLLRLPDGVQSTMPIARALRHHVPARVAERRIRASVDTAENRFVKSFLGIAAQVIDDMRETVDQRVSGRRAGATAFEQRLLADCDAMSHALAPFVRHPLWREVGRMTHVPAASTVLQRRRGYRDIMSHFARLRMATRLPLDSRTARELLEVKDIALMYELWCYFKVAEAITAHLGRPVAASMWEAGDFEIKVPNERAVVQWADGTRLLYNPTFSRSRPAARRSYSVPLRPDIALQVPVGPNRGLHLLDAKFRLDRIGEVMSADESSMGEDGSDSDGDTGAFRERSGDYKRADLYKMHSYRDAIHDARSVWILYPGTESRYFGQDGSMRTVDHDIGGRELDGVGAIPLRPDELGTQALSHWISAACRLSRPGAPPICPTPP